MNYRRRAGLVLNASAFNHLSVDTSENNSNNNNAFDTGDIWRTTSASSSSSDLGELANVNFLGPLGTGSVFLANPSMMGKKGAAMTKRFLKEQQQCWKDVIVTDPALLQE